MSITVYEFELLQDGEWQAGGSSTDASVLLDEAAHYELLYRNDGDVEFKFYQRTELSLEDVEFMANRQTPTSDD